MDYIINILILIAIFQTLALSLDLVAGHSGLLSVTQAGFFGIGAYSSAILVLNIGTPAWVGLICGMILAISISVIISLPSLRLQEDYFIIASFGLQLILYNIFNNWMELTNGSLGISAIPAPVFFGWNIDNKFDYLTLSFALVCFSLFIVRRIVNSPFGRVLHSIREDDLLPQAVGKNTIKFLILTFAFSAVLAAAAGSIFAHYITYIDPTSFTVMDSILIVTMVIVGGSGSTFGPIIGATVLLLLPELLRFIGFASSIAGNTKQIIYGLTLLIFIMHRPQGLVGKYDFIRIKR
jgi:branched-chain amino acid transport system permease protein